tara:strand:+ start:1237 stop:2442 length:1206 start_codon:yes stop_codon:yes gene_type:complete
MPRKNYLLQIFFILLTLFSIIKLYDNANNLDAWQYGEWLINYQSGFVRRGLSGELIFLLSSLINNNIKMSFLILLSTLCIFYYFFSYKFIKDIKFNFLLYLIIFSPLFYFFLVIISKVGIKKEIILYLFYILYLINLSSKNFNFLSLWKYIYTYLILLFIHEGFIFYLPYLILPILFLVRKKTLKYAIQQISFLFVFSFLIIIFLYYNKGSLIHSLEICKSLTIYAPMKCEWWGPIYALSHDIHINIDNEPNLFFYLSADFKTNFFYFFYILYSFTPIIFFFKFFSINYKNLIFNKNIFIYFYFFTFFFSLPLFHIAEDWSRWFSIHFHLLSLFIFFLYKQQLFNCLNKSKFNKINNFLLGKKFFIIFLLIYASALHHHHFFFKGVKLELTYYKIYKKITR